MSGERERRERNFEREKRENEVLTLKFNFSNDQS